MKGYIGKRDRLGECGGWGGYAAPFQLSPLLGSQPYVCDSKLPSHCTPTLAKSLLPLEKASVISWLCFLFWLPSKTYHL